MIPVFVLAGLCGVVGGSTARLVINYAESRAGGAGHYEAVIIATSQSPDWDETVVSFVLGGLIGVLVFYT